MTVHKNVDLRRRQIDGVDFDRIALHVPSTVPLKTKRKVGKKARTWERWAILYPNGGIDVLNADKVDVMNNPNNITSGFTTIKMNKKEADRIAVEGYWAKCKNPKGTKAIRVTITDHTPARKGKS